MGDGDRRKVSVAYVTKWATTTGIQVVHELRITEANHLSTGHILIGPKHWTEDKGVAEERYRAALLKASKAAVKRHEALMEAVNAPPKYTEES